MAPGQKEADTNHNGHHHGERQHAVHRFPIGNVLVWWRTFRISHDFTMTSEIALVFSERSFVEFSGIGYLCGAIVSLPQSGSANRSGILHISTGDGNQNHGRRYLTIQCKLIQQLVLNADAGGALDAHRFLYTGYEEYKSYSRIQKNVFQGFDTVVAPSIRNGDGVLINDTERCT